MDYSNILEELNKASTFDLYRLRVAIDQQLESPQRLSAIKRYLKPGQKISYFDAQQNREIEAEILKIRRTRVLVQNLHDQAKWTIPLYFVNLDKVETDIINSSKEGLDKTQLKVGDMVVFLDKEQNDLHGNQWGRTRLIFDRSKRLTSWKYA